MACDWRRLGLVLAWCPTWGPFGAPFCVPPLDCDQLGRNVSHNTPSPTPQNVELAACLHPARHPVSGSKLEMSQTDEPSISRKLTKKHIAALIREQQDRWPHRSFNPSKVKLGTMQEALLDPANGFTMAQASLQPTDEVDSEVSVPSTLPLSPAFEYFIQLLYFTGSAHHHTPLYRGPT